MGHQGSQVDLQYLGSGWESTITKLLAPDSSHNKLSIDLLTVQIGCTEVPLASFLFVLSLYGESGLGGYAVLPCNGFIYDHVTNTIG